MAVQLKILNFKKMYKDDIKSGNGFVITDPEGINDAKERTEGGIYSPKFGTSWGDANAFAERYKCSCGYLIGRLHEHEVCPRCNNKVKFVDNNFEMTGWLKLDKYHLIHPTLFHFIEYIIGNRKIMDSMLKFECPVDIKGKINKKSKPLYKTGNPEIDIFLGKGMIDFYENFDAILAHFYKLKLKKNSNPKKVKAVYEFLQKHRDSIFIKHVPIFTLLLRPIIITDENFRFGEVNKKYAILTKKIFKLNENEFKSDVNEKRILNNLYASQKTVNDVYDMILDAISKKEGHIRSNVLGNRFNYSSRNVITPVSKVKINEIKLPYLGFLELYKNELINLLVKMENISYYEATEYIEDSYINKNEKVYQLMKYLIKNSRNKLKVLINRNPTINYGSILAMKVKDVKPDYSDYTMSLPIFVLGVLAGDFDGDVCVSCSC